ncbi:MAG: helix-turn-helix domain-containing protein [Treponema sp.]|nr:helix-turn-helix domain-containing protein [Treponema sp.]
MESYGAILKKARESKNLDFETIERATSITRQYLESLEAEDSAAFPGEPYLVGFLRNYASYLGIDSAELIKLYYAKKTQESPVPPELLARHRSKFLVPLIISLLVLLLGGAGAVCYFFVFKVPQAKEDLSRIITESSKVHQYTFSGKTEKRRLYRGDQILVPDESGNGAIILTVSKTVGSLAIETPSGTQYIDLSEERELDVDGDGDGELIVYLSDISTTDLDRGAEVRMLLKKAVAIENESSVPQQETEETSINARAVTMSNTRRTQVLEDNRAYPFTVNVSFRAPCVFRYRVDNNAKVENYYKSGDVVSMTASNGVRLWMSNINAMKIQIIANNSTYDLQIGLAGQVQAEDIKWVRDSDGRYRIVVEELD